MPIQILFQTHLVLGYVAWLLAFFGYILPKFRTMEPVAVQRFIATLHSFRFFGLVFILPGVVGPRLPESFATCAAWGDFTTGVVAMLALLSVRIRPLFLLFVVAYTLLGIGDLLIDYARAVQANLPAVAGDLGAAYIIPVVYVPLLMITHVTALYWLVRRSAKTAPAAKIEKIA